MRKSLPVFFVALIFSICHSMAQDAKPKPSPEDSAKLADAVGSFLAQEHVPKAPQTIQSPNAAGLGSYGEIPVSLYTGKPEINVNLYTISDGQVTIPISLNYDASGVRPDVHPGWVGLNFNLSTNYAIVRTIRDAPDEGPEGISTVQAGYLRPNVRNLLNYGAADWVSPAELKAVANNSNALDTEPDEYSFSAPGLSGKFYMGQDGLWKIQCDRPIKVEYITNILIDTPFSPPHWTGNMWYTLGNYMPHLVGFRITDDRGAKYEFGGSNAYTEYSMDFFDQGKDTWICNAWNLKSITQQTGQVVNFTYERGDFVAQMYFSVYNKTARVDGGSWFSCSNWSSLISQKGPYSGKLISPIYLKEISGTNFKVKFTSNVSNELPYTQDIFDPYVNYMVNNGQSKVDFLTYLYDCFYPVNNAPGSCDYNTTLATLLAKLKWRKLDNIEIQNGSGTTIREFELKYLNVATSRLMLQTVQEKSGTKVIPPYTFTYFTDGAFTLPGYSKSHTDHWGFNNGLLINIATDFNSIGTYGTTYRNPATDVRHLKIGSIASIQYPTGGVTKFIFEPHTFAKEVMLKRWDGEDSHAANQRAGGLRIKEIHNYDNVTGPVVSKKYYYLSTFNPASPDTATTVLSSGILGGRAKYYWPDYMPLPDNAGITVEEEIFSTQSVLPASENSMGSHLGYSQVVERSSTEGWTIHKFSNFDNGYRDNAPSGFIQPSSTPYQPYNSTAFQRGKTLVQERYFQNGNMVSKSEISYILVGTATDNARAVKASTAYLCNTFNSVFEATGYVIDVRKFFPSLETKYTYDQDNVASFVTETASKSYWPNGQLYVAGQSDSRGRTLKTWYKYPPDLAAAPSPAMTLANIIATPFEVFQYTGTEAAPSAIKLQTVTFNSTAPYLPSKVESKLGASGATTTDIEFLSYDPRGNLLTYKEKNGLTTKLEYYQTTDVGKTDLLKQRTLADGASRSQATAYDYTPLIGVKAITDPNAKTINYDYDEFGRLITVKNSNGNARASYCYNYAGQLTPCTALAPTGSIAATGLVLIGIPGALPVTLVEFEATKVEKTVLLSWSTTTETNSERFNIERSNDGKRWIELGAVIAKGESKSTEQYSFVDRYPQSGTNGSSENLYRLKMIDRDGTFAYSRIRSVTFGNSGKVALYPNPVTIGEKLTLLTDDLDKIASIKIFDTSGRMIDQSSSAKEISTAKLAPGLYMVQITYTDGSLSTHRVVKQ